MRLDSDFEMDGLWWIPGNDRNRIAGKVRCRESGRCELEALGTLSGLPIEMANQLPAILGFSKNGKMITMQECHMITTSMNHPGISTAVYGASTLLVGAHVPHAEIPFFRTVRFNIEGLGQWLALSGFTLDVSEDREAFTMNYRLPPNISRKLDRRRRVGIEYSWVASPSRGIVTVSYELRQSSVFRVDFTEDVPVSQAREIIFRISNLLCLATSSTLNLKSCVLSGPSLVEKRSEDIQIPHDVEMYYDSLPSTQEDLDLKADIFLFRFQDIRRGFGKFLKAYFRALKELDDILDLYFSLVTRRGMFLEQRFLGMIQVLEAFHRRTGNSLPASDEAHQKRVSSIINAAPEEHQDWLESRLVYSNEPNLGSRLKSLMEPAKEFFWKNSKERKSFVRKIVDTRNYLTHYSPGMREKRAAPNEMAHLAEILRALFEVNLLRALDFDDHMLASTIENNRRLQSLLRRTR